PLILIVGAALRFYHNTSIALWHDEAFSALYLKYSWAEMMHRIALDVHPPLYYIILRLYAYVFGDGLFSLRLLSIIFGLLTIYAGYLLVKKIWNNENWALLSALALALNPFQIQYSLEARMYTMGTFLALISCYLLVKALKTNQKKHWILYAVAVAAAVYTHYYLVFTVAAQGLYVVYLMIKERKLKWPAISAYALSVVLYLPWLKTFLVQLTRVQEAYWIPAMDRWSIPGTVWKMVFGGAGEARGILILTTLIALAVIVYFLKSTNINEKWLIVLSLVVPFAAAVLLSLKTAIYLDRYFVFASLFFSILIVIAFLQIKNYPARKTLLVLFFALSLIWFFKNWQNLNLGPGMAGASQQIKENAQNTDKIYVGSSFVYFTFKYYNQTDIKPLLYSSGTLESIPHFSGTALLNNDDLILDFKPTPKGSQVWLIWTTGFGGNKPVVPGNWSLVEEKVFNDTPDFKGQIFVDQYHVN
ncbi:MAG: glycosyltransferase family 39 protein, partial [Candidatus Doudnabacteria bacterium]|nr:glycosyltransferase family 39 protein [Candidatus Doudnabacteria bacterium]